MINKQQESRDLTKDYERKKLKGNKVIGKKVYKLKSLSYMKKLQLLKRRLNEKEKKQEEEEKKKTRNRTRDFLHALSRRSVKHIAKTLLVFY